MEGIAFNLTHEIKRLYIGLTAVINESGLVTMIGSVNAKWEEIFVAAFLDLHIIVVSFIRLIHVK